MLPGIFPVVAGGSAAPKLTFVDSDTKVLNSGSGAVVTFSDIDFGDATHDRYLAVIIGHGGGGLSSVTMGGVSASLVFKAAPNNVVQCEIWIAKVPSGASGDVVMTFESGGGRGIGFALYAMTGLTNKGAASDTVTDGDFSDTTMSVTVNIPSQGVAIGGGFLASWDHDPPITWSGLPDVDINTLFGIVGGFGAGFSAGHLTGVSGDMTITASPRCPLAFASFR